MTFFQTIVATPENVCSKLTAMREGTWLDGSNETMNQTSLVSVHAGKRCQYVVWWIEGCAVWVTGVEEWRGSSGWYALAIGL